MSKLATATCVAVLLSYSLSAKAAQYQQIVPNTTLTAETTNNTSAADTFPGCEITTVTNGQCVDNGNLTASNVSKVDVHTLLSASQQGAKVYTTYIPYWVHGTHPNIGYSSQDPNQVTREIADLTSRGFNGVLVDWYGPGSFEEGATEILKSQLEQQNALKFGLMIDQGALEWFSCYPTCSATQALLNVIAFARQKGYFSSPAAIHNSDGKTVVTQFGMEAYNINWSTIQNQNSDLEWIFENAGAFGNGYTVGAYGWLSPKNPQQNGIRRPRLHSVFPADRQASIPARTIGCPRGRASTTSWPVGRLRADATSSSSAARPGSIPGASSPATPAARCRAGRDLARLRRGDRDTERYR